MVQNRITGEAGAARSTATMNGTRRIMVVDDMAVIRDPVSIALRQRGYEVVCARNGCEAMEMLASTHPDLILLDISMPVMDGFTFLRRLRSNTDPTVRYLPVIMLSAASARDRIDEAYSLGARDFLHKTDVTLSDFSARIDRCFSE